jgi:hypothetical protein
VYYLKKSQASTEMLATIAIGFLILVPTSYLFFNYINDSSDNIVRLQASSLGSELLKLTDEVYFLGKGNRLTTEFKIEDDISSIEIAKESDLKINYQTSDGESSSIYFMDLTIKIRLINSAGIEQSCIDACKLELPSGTHKFMVESFGTYIGIKVI